MFKTQNGGRYFLRSTLLGIFLLTGCGAEEGTFCDSDTNICYDDQITGAGIKIFESKMFLSDGTKTTLTDVMVERPTYRGSSVYYVSFEVSHNPELDEVEANIYLSPQGISGQNDVEYRLIKREKAGEWGYYQADKEVSFDGGFSVHFVQVSKEDAKKIEEITEAAWALLMHARRFPSYQQPVSVELAEKLNNILNGGVFDLSSKWTLHQP